MKSELQSFRATRLQPSRTGFSLIEMMVVIGIILLLVALTVGVTAALHAKSETRQAESMLMLLDQALSEWERTSERELSYGPGSPPYDFNSVTYGPNPDALQSAVLEVLMRNAAVANILAPITGDRIKDMDPAQNVRVLRVFDPWDKPVRVLFPGRKWVSTDSPARKDIDGTIRTDEELVLGICVNKRIAFISGGPDGALGTADLGSANPQPSPQHADNIESYPLLKELP